MLSRILIATPAGATSRSGNRITAARWGRILRSLRRQVWIAGRYEAGAADVLVALHARRSYPAIMAFRRDHAAGRLVVALTGTDLYTDLPESAEAQESLEVADRVIVLQGKAPEALPERHRPKVRVIYQSASGLRSPPQPLVNEFEVCVSGHLRPVKDPMRAAQAARLLPASSRVRITHLGAALDEGCARQAEAEVRENPRYRWQGSVTTRAARHILARCRLLVHSSVLEGGANVLSEALACGVPVLSSRIAGSVGILGEAYPGYFETGDTEALADLLMRAETDAMFYLRLQESCRARRELVRPARERRAWRELLEELDPQ